MLDVLLENNMIVFIAKLTTNLIFEIIFVAAQYALIFGIANYNSVIIASFEFAFTVIFTFTRIGIFVLRIPSELNMIEYDEPTNPIIRRILDTKILRAEQKYTGKWLPIGYSAEFIAVKLLADLRVLGMLTIYFIWGYADVSVLATFMGIALISPIIFTALCHFAVKYARDVFRRKMAEEHELLAVDTRAEKNEN